MSTFSVTHTFVANTRARAAQVNTNLTDVLNILKAHHHDPNLYTDASPLTNSGIADNAQIKDTQLKSQITRSGLVNESALDQISTPGIIKQSALPESNPAGSIVMWAGSITQPPIGYLICAGQAVSRTTYADLFSAVGTQFGVGDGSSTFNLPDLRGRFVLGLDNMGGISADRVTASGVDTMGGFGGEENHTLTTAEMPTHRHRIITNNTGSGQAVFAPPGLSSSPSYSDGNGSNPWLENTGGGGSHNNMPPYIGLIFIIKT